MLIDLVEKTESENVSDMELFDYHKIDAITMMATVRDLHTGKKIIDEDQQRETLIDIMRSANKIWKMRNRIKKGDASLMIQIDEEIEDYLAQGQKIQAIKYYRNEISKLTGTEPLLKESKKYVDSIQIYMEKRNMI